MVRAEMRRRGGVTLYRGASPSFLDKLILKI